MSNEEKILPVLTKVQNDIDSLRIDLQSLNHNETSQPKNKITQRKIFTGLNIEELAKYDSVANSIEPSVICDD